MYTCIGTTLTGTTIPQVATIALLDKPLILAMLMWFGQATHTSGKPTPFKLCIVTVQAMVNSAVPLRLQRILMLSLRIIHTEQIHIS